MPRWIERIVGGVLITAVIGLGGLVAEKIYAFWSCGTPCYAAYAGIKILKPPMP